MTHLRRVPIAAIAAGALVLTGCSNEPAFGLPEDPGGVEDLSCSIPTSQIFSGGVGRDAIPALVDPVLVTADQQGAQYLRDGDRVIGIDLGGDPIAVPLNITWWHEIVNMQVDTFQIAVTHCPLTGSSLVFDRGPLDDVEFGVSGLLYLNNLIMFDRSGDRSFWPQMARGAKCGPRDGTGLVSLPALEMRWSAWRALHPDTRVVGSSTGHSRDYRLYPYGDYDEPDNARLLFQLSVQLDGRRPPKERTLGIPGVSSGGIAFPFGTLAALGPVAVVQTVFEGQAVAVFWDARAEGGMAYRPMLDDGTELSFRVENGGVVDDQTGSSWRLDGLSTGGLLLGERLRPVANAYVSFWFAWAAFHPGSAIWSSD